MQFKKCTRECLKGLLPILQELHLVIVYPKTPKNSTLLTKFLQLSSESRRYFAQFRKLFQQISERNQGNNDFSISVQNAMARIREKNNANSQNVPVTRIEGNTDKRFAIRFLGEEDLPDYLRAGVRTNKYKQQAIDNGQKIILTNPDEIRGYIEKAIAGKKDLPTVAYGKVDIKLSEETSDYSDGNIQISDYYLELVATDIRHAYREHLYAKESGDIDLSIEDFINIPFYVATYDDFVYAINYKSGNTKICLSKKISDGRVLVIETVSKSHGSIEFKNMIGVSEEKYLEEYEKSIKKETARIPEGAKAPITLRVTKPLLVLLYPKTPKKSTLLTKFL